MNILHICLASYYTEGMTYQDNQLADQNVTDGHNVTIISNASKYEDGRVVPTGKQDIVLKNNIRLIRLPYLYFLGELFGSKLKAVCGLYKFIEETAPDVILHHGVGGLALLTVVKYKKRHPNIKLYIDSHAEYANSGTTWLSRVFQHKLFHVPITRYAYQYIEKLLCVSNDSMVFLSEVYDLPKEKLEFYPLGGYPMDARRRAAIREKTRAELKISDNDILLCHTGKLDRKKRTTELLEAFAQVADRKLKMIILGSIPDNIRNGIMEFISKDSRVCFLGWKSGDELLEYLCACDLYCQPGSQSATLQNAICCSVPVMIYPHTNYKPLFKDNGWFVKNTDDMKKVFDEIVENPDILNVMSENSYKIAREILDYKKLASRIYE